MSFNVRQVRLVVAVVLLCAATLPTIFLLVAIVGGFQSTNFLLTIIAAPGALTLYAAYFATIVATLLGAEFLSSLKIKRGDTTEITPTGAGVLGYTGVIGVLGVFFLVMLSYPVNFERLRAVLETGAQGGAQVQSYASWAVGTCLTIFSSILGAPAPGAKS